MSFCGGASKAWATCGDYLAHSPNHHDLNAYPADERPDDAPAPKPCSGPNCSGRSHEPVAPLHQRIASPAQEWAILSLPQLDLVDTDSWSILATSVGSTLQHGIDILRPPRMQPVSL
jgi:hypothetical protein